MHIAEVDPGGLLLRIKFGGAFQTASGGSKVGAQAVQDTQQIKRGGVRRPDGNDRLCGDTCGTVTALTI